MHVASRDFVLVFALKSEFLIHLSFFCSGGMIVIRTCPAHPDVDRDKDA